jgi:hypothetical protein
VGASWLLEAQSHLLEASGAGAVSVLLEVASSVASGLSGRRESEEEDAIEEEDRSNHITRTVFYLLSISYLTALQSRRFNLIFVVGGHDV